MKSSIDEFPSEHTGTVEGGAPPDLIEPFRFWEHLDVEGAVNPPDVVTCISSTSPWTGAPAAVAKHE